VRVLIIEDEERFAETVRRGLIHEGFAVDHSASGDHGLWAATENSYDVIILDIMLPGLNGYKVLEQLRSRGIWTPVLMLTAKDGEYDQADALDLGADDYLTKPFSLVVLTARLRALLRRGARERPAVLQAGDLTLDPGKHLVERAGTAIALTTREFGVLEFLLRHKGNVVSKTEILNGVWDAFYDGDSNVVEVYVRYLRTKIDLPFGRRAIETVRGAGYRLASDGG
jgi:two-component system OmpR family response regulator